MSRHTPEQKWALNDHGWCMEADEYENQPLIVACVNALADRDPSKLADLEKAIEHAASVFDECSMPAPAAHLRAALAAFRKRVPTSDTPKGPYIYWYQDDEAYFEYNSEILTLDEICALINSQHAEIERLRISGNEMIRFLEGYFDDSRPPLEEQIKKLRTALENRQ